MALKEILLPYLIQFTTGTSIRQNRQSRFFLKMDNDYLNSLFQTDDPTPTTDILPQQPHQLLQQSPVLVQMSPILDPQMSPTIITNNLNSRSMQQQSPSMNLNYVNYQQQMLQQQLQQNLMQQQIFPQQQVMNTNQQLQNYVQSLQQRGLSQSQIQLHLMQLNQRPRPMMNNNNGRPPQILQQRPPIRMGAGMGSPMPTNMMQNIPLPIQQQTPSQQILQNSISAQQQMMQKQMQPRPLIKRPEGTPIFASAPQATQIFTSQQLHGLLDQSFAAPNTMHSGSLQYHLLNSSSLLQKQQPEISTLKTRNQLVSNKKRLDILFEELDLKNVDGKTELLVLQLADFFIEQVVHRASKIAKHSAAGHPLRARDLQLELGISIIIFRTKLEH